MTAGVPSRPTVGLPTVGLSLCSQTGDGALRPAASANLDKLTPLRLTGVPRLSPAVDSECNRCDRRRRRRGPARSGDGASVVPAEPW